MRYSIDERKKIYENAKKVYNNDEVFEIKIKELFKYKEDIKKSREERLKNTNEYFAKINDILYLLNANHSKVMTICIDALIDYEYFNHHVKVGNIKDEAHYKYKQISQKFKDITPFLEGENIKLNTPILPNTTYNEAYYELKKIGVLKDDSITLLNIIFDKEKKAKVPKEYKRELIKIYDTLQNIIDGAKSTNKHEDKSIKYHQNKLDELKKSFD